MTTCRAVADTAGAIADGAPVIWEENGSNLAYDWSIGRPRKPRRR